MGWGDKKTFCSGLATCLFFATPVWAATPPTAPLITLVQGFYAPYLDDKDQDKVPAATDVIAPHATKQLQALIHKDEACEIREQGVCNLDMDPIIDGQDWDLNGKAPVVSVLQQNATSITLAARFTSDGTATGVAYKFTLENGAWRLADLSRIGGAPADAWDLVAMLSAPE